MQAQIEKFLSSLSGQLYSTQLDIQYLQDNSGVGTGMGNHSGTGIQEGLDLLRFKIAQVADTITSLKKNTSPNSDWVDMNECQSMIERTLADVSLLSEYLCSHTEFTVQPPTLPQPQNHFEGQENQAWPNVPSSQVHTPDIQALKQNHQGKDSRSVDGEIGTPVLELSQLSRSILRQRANTHTGLGVIESSPSIKPQVTRCKSKTPLNQVSSNTNTSEVEVTPTSSIRTPATPQTTTRFEFHAGQNLMVEPSSELESPCLTTHIADMMITQKVDETGHAGMADTGYADGHTGSAGDDLVQRVLNMNPVGLGVDSSSPIPSPQLTTAQFNNVFEHPSSTPFQNQPGPTHTTIPLGGALKSQLQTPSGGMNAGMVLSSDVETPVLETDMNRIASLTLGVGGLNFQSSPVAASAMTTSNKKLSAGRGALKLIRQVSRSEYATLPRAIMNGFSLEQTNQIVQIVNEYLQARSDHSDDEDGLLMYEEFAQGMAFGELSVGVILVLTNLRRLETLQFRNQEVYQLL